MEKKIILISGGTASGKSMIAKILYEEYLKNDKKATMIKMDNYYISIDKLNENKSEKIEGKDFNWDSPDAIDWNLFKKDIKKLESGENIFKAPYEFSKYSHAKEELEYISNDYIIVEGLFALYEKEIRDLASLMIFISVDDEVRLKRRISRDKSGRYKDTFNHTKFLKKWNSEINAMHQKHVQPTSKFANNIIKNNEDITEMQRQKIIDALKSIMIK